MEIKRENLEKFFLLDIKIKELMNHIAPNPLDEYDSMASIDYGEKFYNTVIDIEFYFDDLIKCLNLEILKDYIQKLFAQIKKNIMNCNYNFKKLSQCYETNISHMDLQTLEKIKDNFIGYYLNADVMGVIAECKTVNETLHAVHSYVINNENILQALEKEHEKINDYKYPIILRGYVSDLALSIFENFPKSLDCGWTDIISLKNPEKIILMVRDRGHALSIEVTVEDDKIWVSYFIPKICNVNMVNALKGVRKVDGNSKTTTGSFVTDREHLNAELINFIEKVPMDSDMEILQGTFDTKKQKI